MTRQDIEEKIKQGKTAFLCGAGVSFNSGIPIVNQFLKKLLETLELDSKRMQLLLESNLPFESFMETVIQQSEIKKIYEVFKNTEPTNTHKFLAKCIIELHNPLVVTTNFDTLIEDALKNNQNVTTDIRIIKNLEKIETKSASKMIVKIHGSIDEEDNIDIILSKVASNILYQEKTAVLQELFCTGNHDIVIVMGYSCSDIFDIVPIIESFSSNTKQIVFVEHIFTNEIFIEDIKTATYKNPFKNYEGVRIKIDTDQFIATLNQSLFHEELAKHSIQTNWQEHIENWATQFDKKGSLGDKKTILFALFMKITKNTIAFELLEETLKIFKDHNRELSYYLRLQDRGLLKIHMEDFKNAILDLNEAISYYKENVMVDSLRIAYNNLGGANLRVGNHEEAIKNFENSIAVTQKYRLPTSIGNPTGNLAQAYFYMNNFEICKKHIDLAKEIALHDGDVSLLANMQSLLNEIEIKLDTQVNYSNDFAISHDNYKNIGADANTIAAYFRHVDALIAKHKYKEARGVLLKGKEHYSFNPQQLSRFNTTKLLIFIELNQLQEVEQLFVELKQNLSNDNLENEDKCLLMNALARYHKEKSEYLTAVDYLSKAVAIAAVDYTEMQLFLRINLIETLSLTSELQRMISLINETLPMIEESGSIADKKTIYNRKADYYNIIEDDISALKYFTKTYNLCIESEDIALAARTLNSVAKTYANIGQIKDAYNAWILCTQMAHASNQIALELEVRQHLDGFRFV